MILINLPSLHLRQPDAQVPLGLLYLAAAVQDCQVKNYATYTMDEAIEDLPEDDIYGITCTSFQLPQANNFSAMIRDKFHYAYIILGGPGTVTPEFVDWTVVDSILQGEGERTINQIISEQFSYRIYKGLPADVNACEFPARYLVEKQGGNIFGDNKNYFEGGSAQIITSRGCQFKCAFCSAAGSKARNRKIEDVINEIKYVKDEYGIRQFRIADDNFTADKKRVLEFCEKVGALNIAFRISARVRPFDIDMATWLKSAGCKEISFGVESFSDRVLKGLNKKTTASDNAAALMACKYVGIKTRALLMIGTPFQTKDTIEINKCYINSLPIDLIACTHFVPIPVSDVYNNPKKYDIEIINYNLADYNFYSFDVYGKRGFKNIFTLKDRDMREVREENMEFIEFLEQTGKLNEG